MHKKRKSFVWIFVALVAIFFVWKTAPFYPFLFQLLFNRGINLKQTDSKVNILLLGIGGGSHEGTNLTDTIILANIDSKNSKVNLVSIPRDLWFPDINQKINFAYAQGEAKRKGGGLLEARAAIAKITGQNVDYGIRIDFSGFIKAVDIVGGLEINVENTFDDYEYPIDGKEDDTCGNSIEDIQAFTATASADENAIQQKFPCRFMHVHFDKGLNHMNGMEALEYVRSRHALGIEGGDFARSKRQQKIIEAFKATALSTQTITNPAKILGLYNTLKGSIDTDIKQDEFDDFIRLAEKMKSAKIQTSVLDIGDTEDQREGLLIEAPISQDYDYLSVLIPRLGNGNYSEIQNYISCQIETGNCPILPKPKN